MSLERKPYFFVDTCVTINRRFVPNMITNHGCCVGRAYASYTIDQGSCCYICLIFYCLSKFKRNYTMPGQLSNMQVCCQENIHVRQIPQHLSCYLKFA